MGKGDSDPNKRREESSSQRQSRRAAERRAARAEQVRAVKRKEDPEESNRRWVIGGVFIIILIAIGFIGFGWYKTKVEPLRKTVLRVEDTKYNMAHLERRMELELDTGGNFSRTSSGTALLNLPDFVLSQLEGEAALLHGLDELGLEVTDEDVAAEIRSRGGLADDVDAATFADEVRDQVSRSGLKQNEYELMIRGFVAEQKATDYYVYIGPREEAQARGQMLVVETEEEAQDAYDRIAAGENFHAVAEEVSLDPNTIDIDWFVRGQQPTVFEGVEDYFFTGDVGVVSEPIENRNFFYVVEALERDDARELDEDQRQIVANRELGDFINGLRETLDIDRNLSQQDAIDALEDVL